MSRRDVRPFKNFPILDDRVLLTHLFVENEFDLFCQPVLVLDLSKFGNDAVQQKEIGAPQRLWQKLVLKHRSVSFEGQCDS
ncbi:MAG TPA: hypothetical protein VJO12_04045 [Stellaceae bacterium]|nr:hypothetical protein [Stellaceae bacterium]